jgi:DNA-binding NarL/FixJ family response regulator
VTAVVDRTAAPARRAGRFGAMVVVAQPALRAALVHRLQALGASDVLEAASVAEARARARSAPARELVVVDGALSDGSAAALIQELRQRGWRRGVLLSTSDDPYTVRGALGAGVHGFVVSTLDRSRVPAPRPHQGEPVRIVVPTAATGPEALSAREVEVLSLVAEGRSNKDVGDALGLSALTVKSHLARIARKLGTGDRAEMVVLAMRAGLID